MEQVTATLNAITVAYDWRWDNSTMERDVAVVRLTPSKRVAKGNGYVEGGTYVQYTRVPSGVNKAELAQALRETMGGSNCTHAYDCCGCVSRFIMTKMIGTRTMQVRTKISYNY